MGVVSPAEQGFPFAYNHSPRLSLAQDMRAKSALERPASALLMAVLWNPEGAQPFTSVFMVRL